MKEKKMVFSQGLADATGKIPVTLQNDMVLHSVTQRSKNTLKGLICALLEVQEADVKEVDLLNPIDYKNYKEKEIILDIRVLFNNREIVNVEVQCYRMDAWTDRSVYYLCRSYLNLDQHDDYADAYPVTQISIMNYTLFADSPEFYAKYRLMNEKNHRLYSSKIKLNVLDLTQIERANEEGASSQLVHWAKLFLAETWEELRSLCNGDEIMMEAAEMVYDINITPEERVLAEAHEKYLMDKRVSFRLGLKRGREEAEEQFRSELEQKNSELEQKDAEIARLKAMLEKENA